MRISLDHAHIFASNLPATVEFLVDMFDAKIVWDEEAAGARSARLAIGSAFIHVYAQPPRVPRGGTVHHIGIETDDLDSLVNRMASKGYVFRNPVRAEPKFKYVMVAEPDDLLIELFECHEPGRWGIPTNTALSTGESDA